MYDVNVLGTLHVTQALQRKLIASGEGTIVVMGSTAGFAAYEGAGTRGQARRARDRGDPAAGTVRPAGEDHRDRAGHGAHGRVRGQPLPGDEKRAAAVYAGVPRR